MRINKLNKTILISFLFMTLFCMTGTAQNKSDDDRKKQREEHWKEYMQSKRNYLIKETGMSQKESDEFFPLYEEMLKKKFEVQRNMRKKMRAIENSKEKISDEVYLSAAKAIDESKYTEGQIDKEYFEKFKKILPPKKLYKYEKAELDFFKDALNKNQRPQHHQKK